ncbi:DUF362 domain-containing protein [Isachenkonia alkalipeptolytica]|uniref:Ferredoxin n=1 Tax=Isachenkonia alkalipeptolytica TaxID=2565777 RepID=A0AA43XMI7_9CLOT|nr:DUF362 domain-containing protein [Isachenkonia alkalipeptolytica]NBG89176.1 DUF362 domain-containing protein [Isachenkonia alkalipeptolytica]
MNTVSLQPCDQYQYLEVKEAINKNIEDLGGLTKYVKPKEKILLKLNLLMKKNPEEGVTTHPIFVKALGDILKEYGCDIIIADSPGGPFNKTLLRGVYRVCGIEAMAEHSGFELNYNTAEITKPNPGAEILTDITAIEVLEQVDKVISVSKLKTHGMMKFTGAVKNMYGIVPGLIKAEYHFQYPELKNFSNMLVDVCNYKTPVLSFMDGIIGMEGEGPSAGDLRKVGAVIGSSSPYALDVVACQLVNIDPFTVPTILRSVERGLLDQDFAKINIQGILPENFMLEPFKTPDIVDLNFAKGRVPQFLEGPINSVLLPKPTFDHEQCISCGDCAKVCPAQVIRMKNKKPYADLRNCIRCFCCQELCPVKAVHVKHSLLKRLFFSGKKD